MLERISTRQRKSGGLVVAYVVCSHVGHTAVGGDNLEPVLMPVQCDGRTLTLWGHCVKHPHVWIGQLCRMLKPFEASEQQIGSSPACLGFT
eukprot:5022400-Amphidinium_carterae.1